jgi:hypothetical protein
MPWGRLDDSLYDHPKLDALGDERLPALGLWVSAISFSNRYLTDGYISAARVALLGGSSELADLLTTAGLFDAVEGGGYFVHDFLEFNESKVDVESRRESDRTRKRLLRDSDRTPTGVHAESTGSPNGLRQESTGSPPRPRERAPAPASRPVPSRPYPASPAPAPARPVRNSVASDPLLREIRAAVEKHDLEAAAGVEDL